MAQAVAPNAGQSTPTVSEVKSAREPTLAPSPTNLVLSPPLSNPTLGPMASRVAILQVCPRFYRLLFLYLCDMVVISHKNQASPSLKRICDQATLRDRLRRLRIEIRASLTLKKIINCK